MTEPGEDLPSDLAEGSKAAKFWHRQIEAASKNEREWRKDAERYQERYRCENYRHKTSFPIFWSNIQTLKPNVYSALPRPDVRRRNIFEDDFSRKLGTDVAIVLENGLDFAIEDYGFNEALEYARDDMLITGRGVAREAYASDTVRQHDLQIANPPLVLEPKSSKKAASYTNDHPDHDTRCHHCTMFRPPDGCTAVNGKISPQGHCQFFAPATYTRGGALVEPDGFEDDGRPYVEVVENERVETRYVFWADFRISPARCWADVWWVGYRHAMDRDELRKEFPDVASKIPLNIAANSDRKDTGSDEMPADVESPFGRAEVWEIWNKRKRQRIWIAIGYEDDVLRTDPDPLRLSGFFPMPMPIYAIPTTDTMEPMGELAIYESLADELDEVQDRLRRLTKLAKATGVTDGDLVEMNAIANAADGDMIPIRRPEVVAADLKAAIWQWPLGEIVQAIAVLRLQSQELRQAIYELTGISDLRRGIGQERESATAQKLKASYGSVRMTPRSKPMAEFIRDLLRIKAEIMAEHFEPETLARISGQDITPPVLTLLREEKIRNTAIDVETDSTVAPDAEAEKADAIEFVTAMTQYLSAAAPLAMQLPILAPLLLSTMRAAAQPFKFARQLEDEIDTLAKAAIPAVQPPLGPGGPPSAPPGNGAVQPGMLQ